MFVACVYVSVSEWVKESVWVCAEEKKSDIENHSGGLISGGRQQNT